MDKTPSTMLQQQLLTTANTSAGFKVSLSINDEGKNKLIAVFSIMAGAQRGPFYAGGASRAFSTLSKLKQKTHLSAFRQR